MKSLFMLCIAALLAGLLLLYLSRKRASALVSIARAGLGNGSGSADAPHSSISPAPLRGRIGVDGIGGVLPVMADDPNAEVPIWFDDAGFIDNAKIHFMRLQAAWDQSDLQDLREYTAPQLFAEIKREREALGDAPEDTEIVTLNAELLALRRNADQIVAEAHFHGLTRKQPGAAAKPFDEVWLVTHDWDNASGDWLIASIRQTS